MKPAPFRYARPDTLADAIRLLGAEDGGARLLAGGQSLVPMLNMRLARPSVLVDLGGVPGLGAIARTSDGGLRIGALVRHAVLASCPLVAERAPLLAEAARHVGHIAIRNRGTLGGSLAHADPAAELPAAMVALSARFALVGARGERLVDAGSFFRGLFSTALEPDEVLVEALLPPPPAAWGFAEVARRPGDFALAGVAVALELEPGAPGRCRAARAVAFGVGDRPVSLAPVETALGGAALDAGSASRAASLAAGAVDPPADVHASSDYRRHLAGVLAEDALAKAIAGSRGAR